MRRVQSVVVLPVLGMLALLGGCQSSHVVSSHQLMEHQATVDFSGLESTRIFDDLKVVAAPPRRWVDPVIQNAPLYIHQQWRSPSHDTGVGVAYLHLPIPLSTGMVVWFAKQQYGDRASDGKMIAEWTDVLGREWFEAENNRFHVRGYVISRGFEAWVVYYGYKKVHPPSFEEMTIASRSAESMVPGLEAGDDHIPLPKDAPRMAEAEK